MSQTGRLRNTCQEATKSPSAATTMTANASQPRNATVRELTASPITVAIAGQQQHDQDQRRRQHAVDHGRREEQLDRVQPRVVQRDAQRHRRRRARCRTSWPGRGRRFERPAPGRRLGDRVGARSRQHRHGQHAGADQSQREQPVGAGAGQRPQRFGGLLRGRDVRLAVRVQRRRRRQDDEVHDRVRGEHAGHDVGAAGVELLGRRAAAARQIAAHRALFLDFLRRLPEKQIRRDRRAEDRDQHREERARPFDVRNERRLQREPPVDAARRTP